MSCKFNRLVLSGIILTLLFNTVLFSQEEDSTKRIVVSSVDNHPEIIKLKNDYIISCKQYSDALASNFYSQEELTVLKERADKAYYDYTTTRNKFVKIRKNTVIETNDILILDDDDKNKINLHNDKFKKLLTPKIPNKTKINPQTNKQVNKPIIQKVTKSTKNKEEFKPQLTIEQQRKNEEMKRKMLMIMNTPR